MHRRDLIARLERHATGDTAEKASLETFVEFVAREPRCFDRALAEGHVTGSAWIVAPGRDRVLLTHHRKLDRWLQLGGHADGDSDVLRVAMREAREESGITEIDAGDGKIFDVDVHRIPARAEEPEHFHYDARFLFEADPNRTLVVSRESKDLAWIALDELERLNVDVSVLRMARKTTHCGVTGYA